MRKPLWPAGFSLIAIVMSLTALPTAMASAGPVAGIRPGTAAWTMAHGAAAAGRSRTYLSYELENRYSSRCVDDPGQSTQPTQQLQQYRCNGTVAQIWTEGVDANGYIFFQNIQNGLCIADIWGAQGNGVPAEQYFCDGDPSEEWNLEPIGIAGDWYLVNRANSGRCLGVTPNWGVHDGDPLAVLNCDWGADQQWIFRAPGFQN